jgi:hypothetical protein
MLYVTATMIYGYAGPLPGGTICCYSNTATVTHEVLGSPVDLSKVTGDAHSALLDELEVHNATALEYMSPLSFSYSFVRL